MDLECSEKQWSSIRDTRLLHVPEKTIALTLLDGTSVITIADRYTMHLEEGWVNLHKDGEVIYSRRLDDIMTVMIQ